MIDCLAAAAVEGLVVHTIRIKEEEEDDDDEEVRLYSIEGVREVREERKNPQKNVNCFHAVLMVEHRGG